MASPTSTFATLRALHLVIADALDDMQRVFSQNGFLESPAPPASQSCSCPSSPDPSPAASPFPATPPASFPPTPLSATFPSPPHTDVGIPLVDYPSPDLPLVSDSLSEQLALHPDAVAAATKIVAACGQISNIVHKPFLSLCDASMSFSLPACMRLVEHLHVAEILREAEVNKQHRRNEQPFSRSAADLTASPSGVSAHGALNAQTPVPELDWMPGAPQGTEGLHVVDITNVICSYAGANYVDSSDLVHALRLLSTHHIFRETLPDTFTLNRVASLLDSGKSVEAVFSDPKTKYDDSGGTSAFVASTTDELFKSAAYLTEAFTGVQLPTLASSPIVSFPADAALSGLTIPSTSGYVITDPSACPPTTRSSSILTNIVHPQDEDTQLLSCRPPRLSPVGTTKQIAEFARSVNATKAERLVAFNLAFGTNVPFFEWLENGGEDPLGGTGQGASICNPGKLESVMRDEVRLAVPGIESNNVPEGSFRLQRFSNAMKGSIGWEAPKAILSGFDWCALPSGSTIVDVGGGIGSTTMVLARALNGSRPDSVKKQDGTLTEGLQTTPTAILSHKSKLPNDPSLTVNIQPLNNGVPKYSSNLRFVVQDRPVVTALGVEAWRSECPGMLQSGEITFQDHDFFEPQPPLEPPHITRHPSVYLLRVVLHDWPDEAARRILINLRVASNPETRLVIAEHVLPLACVDEDVVNLPNAEVRDGSSTGQWTLHSVLANIEGAERTLVAPPLQPNLGKASANAYWMDLIMRISLNGKERTLREFCALTLSAGWRVTRMTRPEGLLFAYLVCEPITLPDEAQAIYNAVVLSSELSTVVSVPPDEPCRAEAPLHKRLLLPPPILHRSSSRCGTPTFGSRTLLPKKEELQSPRSQSAVGAKKWFKSKGLGVRSVVSQRAERQREEQISEKSISAQDSIDAQNGIPSSSSHTRVWWKKSSSSTSNSTTAVHHFKGEGSEHSTSVRGRPSTLKSSNSPSTPSPRISPVRQRWPSTESAAVLVSPTAPQARRPSVASITRKLSFARFGRRPSIAEITESLPTPPPSATLTELAPPPALRADSARSVKHLPSLPRSGRSTATITGQPAIPQRTSLNFTSQILGEQPAPQSAPPRLSGAAESPKPGVLKSRLSPHTGKQSFTDVGRSAEPVSISRRQRRVTLSNSPNSRSMSTKTQAQVIVPLDSVTVVPGVRRVPSVPKLPRRLSIPVLRRKQSQSVVQDTKKEG